MTKSTTLSFTVILALLLLTIAACTTRQVDHIVITPQLTPRKQLIGNGVSMLVPFNYSKSEMLNGFQTANKESSISVSTSTADIEEMKASYSAEKLKEQRADLIELSTIAYGDSSEGFFAKTYEEQTSSFQYVLAIQREGKTYLMKAECPDTTHNSYDYKIRQSLLSVHIGDDLKG